MLARGFAVMHFVCGEKADTPFGFNYLMEAESHYAFC